MTNAYILVIPAPCAFINANTRMHWAKRSALTKAWRQRAFIAARNAHLPHMDQRVTITATAHRDHNRGRWDATNLAPTAKAAVDGLVDAGVLTDDSNKYLVGPDMRAGEPWADAALVLTIRIEGAIA